MNNPSYDINNLCEILKHMNKLMAQQISQTCLVINKQTEINIRLNKIESEILSIKNNIDNNLKNDSST